MHVRINKIILLDENKNRIDAYFSLFIKFLILYNNTIVK